MKIFDFQQVIHHLLSLQKKKKKFRYCCSDCSLYSAWNKKTKHFIKLEYISYIMTLNCKKKLKCNKMADFWKRNQNLLKNLVLFGLTKLYFLSNHKTGGSLYGKTNIQYAKKRPKSIWWLFIALQLQQIW